MSARGRILGWSVLLLAAALAASTVVTHVLLVQQLNARVRAELSHEMAEFRMLAARRGAPAGAGPVLWSPSCVPGPAGPCWRTTSP